MSDSPNNKFYNLGLKFFQKGDFRKAITYLKKAVDIAPQAVVYHHLGLSYGYLSENEKAEHYYKKALEIDSSFSRSLNNIGAIFFGKGDMREAMGYFKKALKADASYFPAYNNLGNVYRRMNNTEEAIRCYLKVIVGNPQLPEPYNNLAKIFFEQGKLNEALEYAKKALMKNPGYTPVHVVLGVTYMSLGDYKNVIKSLEFYIKANPAAEEERLLLAKAYNEQGNVYKNNSELEKAIEYYNLALNYDPNSDIIYSNLGLIQHREGNSGEAIISLEKSIGLAPDNPGNYYSLGVVYMQNGNWEQALVAFEKSFEIDPEFVQAKSLLSFVKLRVCDWDNLKMEEYDGDTPLLNLFKCDDPLINRKIAESWSGDIQKKVPEDISFNFSKKKSDKITIGYLSSDFFNHPTSYLISGMLGLHNRKKFIVKTYSYGPNDNSMYRQEIEEGSDYFSDIASLSNIEAAEKINKDGVDILVDLKGFTEGARLEVAALRPSPIQVSWLGFPGTTGSDFIDYFITDRVLTPEKDEKFFSEKLIFMPDTYQVNNYRSLSLEKKLASIGSRFTRGDFGLPKDGFVFCSFNQPVKITPEGFDVWMRIMKKTPKSVLWFWEDNPLMVKNLQKEAEKHGILSSRLIFAASLPQDEHLERLKLADLALDTFTYNGHTTTSDCLWAGVPVITLKGKHFASRVSASLLTAIGLPELITKTPEEYEDLAVLLANNPKKLQTITYKLQTNKKTHPLFDTERFTRNIEKAYETIWKNYLNSKEPENLEVK